MKLLVLSPWFPYPADNGSRLRAWHLIQRLAAHHELTLIVGRQDDSPRENPHELLSLCQKFTAVPWYWHDPQKTGKYGAIRAALSLTPRSIRETPNAELTEAISQALTARHDAVLGMELGIVPYLPKTQTIPILLDQIELSGLEHAFRHATSNRARLARYLTWKKGTAYWRRALAPFAGLTAVSEAEAAAVRRVVGTQGPPVHVLANGVAVREFPRHAGTQTVPGRMVYNGALSYGPNRDAVLWFVEAILPKIREKNAAAHLVVTGRSERAPDALRRHPHVVLTGFVPDLRPVLAEAEVCVVPLRAGGGTRLKILEAWAAGVPVVATAIGAGGLDGSIDGKHFLRAETPERFAEQTLTLLADPGQRRTLATNARHLAEERYDWEGIATRLSALLESIAEKR